ncbi:MAG: 4'-phosphopantetheinyl transferase superfamily protein [Parabacteroides sp.]|nr:4'-phosphopantetheinyl transferase superfamily protein [Parabacteroides sp.]
MILLTEDIYDFDLEIALKEVSEQRRAYALKYKNELDIRLCVKAYLLLCEGLWKKYGITEKPLFEFEKYGKPTLVGYPDIHFNISHCKEAIICVLEDRPVGVDIESIKPFDKELALFTMNEKEMKQILSSQSPNIEFFSLWTQKEAVLKYSGDGVRNNMRDVLSQTSSNKLKTWVSPHKKFVYSICGEGYFDA